MRGDSIVLAVASVALVIWAQVAKVTTAFPLDAPTPSCCGKRRQAAYFRSKTLTLLSETASDAAGRSGKSTNNPKWEPRSRYWKDDDVKGMSPNELAQQMGLDILQDQSNQRYSETTTQALSPTLKKLHRNSKDKVVAVEITAALSELQAARIQSMSLSIGNHDLFSSTQFEHRSFGENKGGNDCTYLAPLLQLLMPEIAEKVVSIAQLAWTEADWGGADDSDGGNINHPSPTGLGIRTSEHLSYNGWRSLEPHKDDGSIYTCNIALKDPQDYQGGDFFLQTSFLEQKEVKPERLSAIVFLSDTTHGVRPIVSGSRESFVTEFWKYDDAPLGMNRPTPDEFEEFTKQNLDDEQS